MWLFGNRSGTYLPMAEEKVQDVNELVKERLKKLDSLAADSIEAYPYKYDRTHYSAQIHEEFEHLADDGQSSKTVQA